MELIVEVHFMLYQETFQSGENPSEINVSSCVYCNGTHQDSKIVKSEYPSHCHSFYELDYTYEGLRELIINGKHFYVTENALFLVPPLVIHSTVGIGKNVNLVLQFSCDFLSHNASTFPKNDMLMPAGEMLENGLLMVKAGSAIERSLNRIREISPNFITPTAEAQVDYSVQYEWELNGLTLCTIEQLLETGNLTVANNIGNTTEVIKIQSVLNRLITYPEEKLSMRKAAQMACMSYSNFSRTFTRIIGRSFVEYCNQVKVHRAEEYLGMPNMSITQISQRLGFGSASYFNRIFKRATGYTPMQYRSYLEQK